MSGELIAILSVGAAIAGLVLASFKSLRSEMAKQREETSALREDIRSLSERVARLEGKLEGWLEGLRESFVTNRALNTD